MSASDSTARMPHGRFPREPNVSTCSMSVTSRQHIHAAVLVYGSYVYCTALYLIAKHSTQRLSCVQSEPGARGVPEYGKTAIQINICGNVCKDMSANSRQFNRPAITHCSTSIHSHAPIRLRGFNSSLTAMTSCQPIQCARLEEELARPLEHEMAVTYQCGHES